MEFLYISGLGILRGERSLELTVERGLPDRHKPDRRQDDRGGESDAGGNFGGGPEIVELHHGLGPAGAMTLPSPPRLERCTARSRRYRSGVPNSTRFQAPLHRIFADENRARAFDRIGAEHYGGGLARCLLRDDDAARRPQRPRKLSIRKY